MTDRQDSLSGGLLRLATAAGLTGGLLLFLVAMRIAREDNAPLLTLRSLESVQPVSLPAPPPPPPETTPPPPPPPPDLPRLQIELDSVAPAVKASLERDLDLRLNRTEFAAEQEAPLSQMTFASSDLDSQPKLVNKPSVTFPLRQKEAGVTEAKVILEVQISSGGIVTVKRVLDSPHEDFTAMARSFASRARFTPPKKDGRSVNALFRWPLILRS
jgi:hypothetical protein